MKYEVFFEETKIGVLEINDKGQHKYTLDPVGTQKVRDSISIFYEVLVEYDWGNPIPFFKNRISDAKKFSKENNITNQTDPFKMVLQKN